MLRAISRFLRLAGARREHRPCSRRSDGVRVQPWRKQLRRRGKARSLRGLVPVRPTRSRSRSVPRQPHRQPTSQADQLGRQQRESRYSADPGADERKCPGRIGEPPDARCPRIDRQPREEGRGGEEAGEEARRATRGTLGVAHNITITGLAKKGANDYISVRWLRLPERG